MTRRLYHDDAYLRRFDATVLAHARHGDRPALVLDETAFYPEAGGQLGDRGTLGDLAVLDTQQLDDGTILHVAAADAALPAVGTRVTGLLDWERRRQHMAQHTAQHLLSGALLERAQAQTASARLGERALTIDAARDRIPEAELMAAEQLANDLIDDDLPVRAWFPSSDELVGLALRRDPKVTEHIRVVAIGDFDHSPCGGTHCARTSQLGTIRITDTERYKGMTRLTFTAARRARAELFTRDQVLRGLASQFSCAPSEVPAAVDRLRRDVENASAQVVALRGQLADVIARSFPGNGAVVAAVPGGDAELLRTVAVRLAAAGRDALLAAAIDDGTAVMMLRAAGSSLDCGALWKKLAAHAGGRGGGRADQAQGKLPVQVADWPQLVSRAMD